MALEKSTASAGGLYVKTNMVYRSERKEYKWMVAFS